VSDKVREALAELIAASEGSSEMGGYREAWARLDAARDRARAALSSEEPAPTQPCPDCASRGTWMPRGGLTPDAPCKRCGGTGRVPPPSPEPAPRGVERCCEPSFNMDRCLLPMGHPGLHRYHAPAPEPSEVPEDYRK
jgi:hypothetical protein